VPRPLTFGNGHLLIQGDRFGVIRDLYWGDPMPFNHLTDGKITFGFHDGERISWIHDGSWEITMTAEGVTSLMRDGFRIRFKDSLESQSFRREIAILEAPGTCGLFVNSHFNIEESDIGNTCLWAPDPGGIVHYKGGTSFLLRLTPPADDFACGHIGFGGFDGTFRDAEDGGLSKNAIAQGSVDATQRLIMQPGDVVVFELSWPGSESEPVIDLTSRDEYLLRTHFWHNGAFIAAGDSDIMETNRANYAYCWMRDGAHLAEVLHELGDETAIPKFLGFCGRAFDSRAPFFRQKYRLDATPGASWHPWTREFPFQEDESASVVALAEMADEVPSWIRPLSKALLGHIDSRTDLPLPSYDLWEERYGTHTYTTACVIRALRVAAGLFPDEGFSSAADAMTGALKRRLFDQTRGHFYRGLNESGNPDWTVDSSTLHVVLAGVLEADDPLAIANLRRVEEKLWLDTMIGGLARYEDDYYFRRDFNLPGNPWVISTMWLAQCHALAGRRDRAQDLLTWADARRGPTGILPEQVDPHTGEHLSVSPLTWSHGEVLRTQLMLE